MTPKAGLTLAELFAGLLALLLALLWVVGALGHALEEDRLLHGPTSHGPVGNGGMTVLFFDKHTEFKGCTEIDLLDPEPTNTDPVLSRLRN